MDAAATNELLLCGEDETSHAAAFAGARPFADTLIELFRRQSTGRAYQLRIPVRQRNLGRLHHVFNLALRLAGNTRGQLAPPFEPRPLTTLRANVEAYIAKLGELARGTPLSVAIEDSGLPELLSRVESQAAGGNEPDLLRLLGLLTEGTYIGPHTFHMDLANSCNENCAYCWFHSPHSKNRTDAESFDSQWKRTHMDFATACRLIDDLWRTGAREDVLLTGKGEPLTHPRCLDIVDYIKAKPLHTTLFTNGVLLTPPNLQRMVSAGLDLIYVSLSSASRETYEALHPGHSGDELELVRQNLLALQKMKAQQNKLVPRVVMVDVVCHDNAGEVEAFAKWSAAVGAEFIRYQLVHVQYYNQVLKLTPEDVASVRAGVARARELSAVHGMRVMENIDYQLETLEPGTGAWGRNELPAEGCLAGWYFSRAWADGTVSFCCSPKPIAQLSDKPFANVWASQDYAAYRSAAKRLTENRHVKFTDGTKLLNSHCYSCPNYEGLADARRGLKTYGLEPWLTR